MLCETCQKNAATVFITFTSLHPPSGQSGKHQFCEECGRQYVERIDPSHRDRSYRRELLRVISVSAERTVVRVVSTDSAAAPEEWSLVTALLPPHIAVVGLEFRMGFSPTELEHLKGNV
jgi:hypothetical protein